MTPEALVAEQKKIEISVWTRSVGTQEHFNQMVLQIRNHFLTLVTAIIGAAALILQKELYIQVGSASIHVASLLFIAGLVVIWAFYLTEKGYHNLLVGAVKHAEGLEKQLEHSVGGIGLSHSISKASHSKIFFFEWKSASRIRAFYIVIVVLFVAAAYVTAQGVRPAADEHASSTGSNKRRSAAPNDLQAGTNALKKFYQNGSYASVLGQVASLAESYIGAELPSIDRARAVAIFDVDETALSTWEILSEGEFTWDPARFRSFALAGRAKRIEPTLKLYQKAKSAGIPIVFVTSRTEDLREATAKNLVAEGFAGFADLIMKPVGSPLSTNEYKAAARARIRAGGKAIIFCIGDQIDDLDPSIKGNFLLPNPFY